MASQTLSSVADLFPVGTTVGAYPVSGWSQAQLPPSGAPVPSATTTATVQSSGSVTFTGLADGTRYFAAADVSGWRYRAFSTAAAAAVAAPVAETVNVVASAGAAQTLPDIDAATIHRLVLDAATCTLTFPTAAAGKSFIVVLIQDATGGRLVTWPGTVKWPGAVAPTLTATGTKRDVFSFVCADGTNWLGFTAGQNFS